MNLRGGHIGGNVRADRDGGHAIAAMHQRVLHLEFIALDHLLDGQKRARPRGHHLIERTQPIFVSDPHNDRQKAIILAIGSGRDAIGCKGEKLRHRLAGDAGCCARSTA